MRRLVALLLALPSALLLALSSVKSLHAQEDPSPAGRRASVSIQQFLTPKSIPPGSLVRFPSGREVPIGEFLGEGNKTVVFEHATDPQRAVRLPKRNNAHFLDWTASGEALLAQLDVPRAEVLAHSPGEFADVRRVALDPTGRLSLANLASSRLTPDERVQMLNALREFARQLAPFERIGDFRAEQVAYDIERRRFVLLDWTHDHVLAFHRKGPAITASSNHVLYKLFEDRISGFPVGMGRREPRLRAQQDPIWLKIFEDLEAITHQERERWLQTPGLGAKLDRWKSLERLGPGPDDGRPPNTRRCQVEHARGLLRD